MITPVKWCEMNMLLTSILRYEVDNVLLTTSRQGDIVQGFHLHMVSPISVCIDSRSLSMLNYPLASSSGGTTTVFDLCSNYFSGIWWLLDKWVLLCFFDTRLFLSAFFACTDLPSLLSGAVCSHSLICASISASVALGKTYHYTVYIIIITCSSPHLNWLIVIMRSKCF